MIKSLIGENKMGVKVFKSLDEQIAILKNKGLIIDDIDYAKFSNIDDLTESNELIVK